ncbi:MAG: metal-dependent transcriptional regulator [Clostridia bacterium]|nr:metal-dependent transcriptional regulator [Clostridia bacterium]
MREEKPDTRDDRFYTLSHYRKQNDRLSPVWEDYLEMICRLSPRLEPVRIRDLAEALHVTPSSASRMAQSMAMQHLLDFQRYGYITLTETGKSMGAFLLRRHRVVCAFLEKLKGSSDELDETEQIEHGISEETVAAMERWLYGEMPEKADVADCTDTTTDSCEEKEDNKELI